MSEFDRNAKNAQNHHDLEARYLSSVEIETVVRLLLELRDSTLSRKSFADASISISQLGAASRLDRSEVGLVAAD